MDATLGRGAPPPPIAPSRRFTRRTADERAADGFTAEGFTADGFTADGFTADGPGRHRSGAARARRLLRPLGLSPSARWGPGCGRQRPDRCGGPAASTSTGPAFGPWRAPRRPPPP